MNTVVIPTYKARASILQVLAGIGPEVQQIIVVDDCCPENSGRYVEENSVDPRVRVIHLSVNLGVGGAFLTGMRAAIDGGAAIIVKIDADGQMDTKLIPVFLRPLARHQADFVKGNRFYFLSGSRTMPPVRRLGNLGLSFLTKMSTGYWTIMDPTNGYFAINASVARLLPADKIKPRFFFESDLLFHLALLRAKVIDIPMDAIYGDEVSNLSPAKSFWPFLKGNLRNLFWRILYKYFLRDFSLASIELLAGVALMTFGLAFGVWHWIAGAMSGTLVPTGTIMIVTLALMFGFQLLMAFLNYDVATVPREPLHPLLEPVRGDDDASST